MYALEDRQWKLQVECFLNFRVCNYRDRTDRMAALQNGWGWGESPLPPQTLQLPPIFF